MARGWKSNSSNQAGGTWPRQSLSIADPVLLQARCVRRPVLLPWKSNCGDAGARMSATDGTGRSDSLFFWVAGKHSRTDFLAVVKCEDKIEPPIVGPLIVGPPIAGEGLVGTGLTLERPAKPVESR